LEAHSGHLHLRQHQTQLLDRARSAGAAVADEASRLVVPLGEQKIDRVLERAGDSMVVLGRDEDVGVKRADLGGPYDAILLTNFLHHFDAAKCTEFLKRLRTVLRPGAKLATLEFIPNPDRISPPMSATFPLIMLASTAKGDAYTFAELDQMLRAAGFTENKLHQPEDSPQQIVISM